MLNRFRLQDHRTMSPCCIASFLCWYFAQCYPMVKITFLFDFPAIASSSSAASPCTISRRKDFWSTERYMQTCSGDQQQTGDLPQLYWSSYRLTRPWKNDYLSNSVLTYSAYYAGFIGWPLKVTRYLRCGQSSHHDAWKINQENMNNHFCRFSRHIYMCSW